jgi:hypothetical protein
MPANTVLKLRAGTQSEWSATSKSKTASSASVVVNTDTVARYVSTAHGFTVGNVVTITGMTVVSGNNPYNVSGQTITAVDTDYFDIKLTTGTTGGSTNGAGTVTLVVLAKGEAAVETNTNQLKIGNGTSGWEAIPYINKPFYYVANSGNNLGTGTGEQDLFGQRMALLPNTTYQFELQVIIQTGNTTSKNASFGFYQTGMTAFATTRYHWTAGTRTTATPHYADGAHTFAGSSPTTSGLIELYPEDTNQALFFSVRGIIRTGNGDSDFRPRIKFSAAPGTTSVLPGAYIRIDPLGPSSILSTGQWTGS